MLPLEDGRLGKLAVSSLGLEERRSAGIADQRQMDGRLLRREAQEGQSVMHKIRAPYRQPRDEES